MDGVLNCWVFQFVGFLICWFLNWLVLNWWVFELVEGISVYIYMLRGLRLAIRGLEDYGLVGLGGWGLGSKRIKD